MRFKFDGLFDGKDLPEDLPPPEQHDLISWNTDPSVLRLARLFIFERHEKTRQCRQSGAKTGRRTGCSVAANAPASGAGDRGCESHHPDHEGQEDQIRHMLRPAARAG